MDIFESKVGSICVLIYAIASIVMATVSFFCAADLCRVLIIVPILPWAVLLERQLGVSIPWAAYPLLLLLNAVILYLLGVVIEMLYLKITNTRA